MRKLKELIIPGIALFIICLVSAFLLAGTNSLTAVKIAENAEKQKIESRKIVLPQAAAYKNEHIYLINGKEVEGITCIDGAGREIGYIFTSSSKGYGGEVTVMTSVDAEGKVIKSVVLSMDDETPGLGQNAGKDDFLDRFTNKSGPFNWVKAAGEGNDIQGVTSATFTSKAVIECVNDALLAYETIKEGK